MRFRPDIEGLRALAVLAVLVFHARLGVLPGGFVGVDVFFTVSGYLITALLLEEVRTQGRIRLLRFYARRARRLLPASLAMTLTVTLLAAFVLAPDEQRILARVVVAVVLYASNLLFAQVSVDYFGPILASIPLTHTWSLAVEEQFYLVWPLVLWGALKVRGQGALVLLTTLTTLPLCIWLTSTDAPLAFFLSPTRAWEFSLGACGIVFAERLRFLRGGLVMAGGLALIVGPMLLMHEGSAFPGALALVPTLGTLVLLVAGAEDATGPIQRALRSAPALELGRLSYGLYLWHWPALVFADPLLGRPPTAPERVLALLVAAVFAKASFHLLEQPIRHAPWLASSRRSLAGAALTMLVGTAGAGALWWRGEQLAAAGPLGALSLAARERPQEGPLSRCHLGWRETRIRPSRCTTGPQDAPVVLLFGDSHAQQLFPALEQAAAAGRIQLVSLTKSACVPVLAPYFEEKVRRDYHECTSFVRWIHQLLPTLDPDLIVATGRDRDEVTPTAWLEGLQALRSATDAAITLVEDIPTDPDVHRSITTCAGRALMVGRDPASCAYARPDSSPVSRLMRTFAAETPGVRVVDLADLVCLEPTDRCAPFVGNHPIWRDRTHLATGYVRDQADAINAELLRPLR